MILGDFGYEGLEEALVCEGKGDNERRRFSVKMGDRNGRGKGEGPG